MISQFRGEGDYETQESVESRFVNFQQLACQICLCILPSFFYKIFIQYIYTKCIKYFHINTVDYRCADKHVMLIRFAYKAVKHLPFPLAFQKRHVLTDTWDTNVSDINHIREGNHIPPVKMRCLGKCLLTVPKLILVTSCTTLCIIRFLFTVVSWLPVPLV